MKKHILLYFILLVSVVVTAQKKEHRNHEKIQSLKIAFISSELDLTPEVAEKFWPVFNAYEKTNRQLRSKEIKTIQNKIDQTGSIESLSDNEALSLSNDFVTMATTYAENKKQTFKKLETILSPQQLLKLHFAEIEFNHKVLRKYKKQNKGQ